MRLGSPPLELSLHSSSLPCTSGEGGGLMARGREGGWGEVGTRRSEGGEE